MTTRSSSMERSMIRLEQKGQSSTIISRVGHSWYSVPSRLSHLSVSSMLVSEISQHSSRSVMKQESDMIWKSRKMSSSYTTLVHHCDPPISRPISIQDSRQTSSHSLLSSSPKPKGYLVSTKFSSKGDWTGSSRSRRWRDISPSWIHTKPWYSDVLIWSERPYRAGISEPEWRWSSQGWSLVARHSSPMSNISSEGTKISSERSQNSGERSKVYNVLSFRQNPSVSVRDDEKSCSVEKLYLFFKKYVNLRYHAIRRI